MKCSLHFFLIKKYIIAVLVIVALSGILLFALGYVLWDVPVDEQRVATILASVKENIPKSSTKEWHRLREFGNLVKNIENIESTWTANEKEVYEDWKLRHYFDRFEISKNELEKLNDLISSQTVTTFINEYIRISKTYQNKAALDNLSMLSVLASMNYGLHEFTLVYCDALAINGKWQNIWPILEANLILSKDLALQQPSFIQSVIGMTITNNTISWLAGMLQVHPLTEKDSAPLKNISDQLKSIEESLPKFEGIIYNEMFLFDESKQTQMQSKEAALETLASKRKRQELMAAHLRNATPKVRSELGDPFPDISPIQEILMTRFHKIYYQREWKIGMKYFLELLDTVSDPEPVMAAKKLIILEKKKGLIFSEAGYSLRNLWKRHLEYLEGEAHLKTAQLLIVLAQYHYDRHTYPSSLVTLVTDGCISEIPNDPFWPNQPFRYRKNKNSFTLYSIALDGEDQGGNESRFYALNFDTQEDLVFSTPVDVPEIMEESSAEKIKKELEENFQEIPEQLSLEKILQAESDKTIKIKISRSFISDSLANVDVYQDIRAVPNFKEDKIFGLKVLSIKPNSFFDMIGLKKGDIWFSINGSAFDANKPWLLWLSKLSSDQKQSKFKIFRNGKIVEITLSFKN